MKSYPTRMGVPALVAFALIGATPALANVEGMWVGKDGTTVRIFNCGTNMCGRVAGKPQTNDPETGKPWTDKKNADPSQRARPLVGVEVLISMRPSGQGKWTGQLYNLDDGKLYKGNLIEVDPATVRVEGCWLGICGGENLTRIRSTASSR
jgi:uncharacterized protein (DUF2147 family)